MKRGRELLPLVLLESTNAAEGEFSTKVARSPWLLRLLMLDVMELPRASLEWVVPVLVLRNQLLKGGFSTAKVGSSRLIMLLTLEACQRVRDVWDGTMDAECLRGCFISWLSIVAGVSPTSGLPGLGKGCLSFLGVNELIMPFAIHHLGEAGASLSAHICCCLNSGAASLRSLTSLWPAESVAPRSNFSILCSRRSNQTSCVASSAVGRSSALPLKSRKMKFLHSPVTNEKMGCTEKSTLPCRVLSFVSVRVAPLNGVCMESEK